VKLYISLNRKYRPKLHAIQIAMSLQIIELIKNNRTNNNRTNNRINKDVNYIISDILFYI